MADKYKNLKVKDLQELLQKQGIPHTGKKEELIERLVKHDERKTYEIESLEAEFGSIDDFDESKLNFDDLHDVDLKSFSATEAKQLSAVEEESKPRAENTEISVIKTSTTTTTQNSVEISQTQEVEIVKPGSQFKFTPISFDKPAAPATTAAADSTADSAQTTAKQAPLPIKAAPAPAPALSELEKKILAEAEKKAERAKRFGVQLDEKAKKELRAARFGIPVAATPASPSKNAPKTQQKTQQKTLQKTLPGKNVASKGIDPETLKKRAERFGLSQKTKTDNSPKSALDPVEEEKKRKRAERFGSEQSKKQKN